MPAHGFKLHEQFDKLLIIISGKVDCKMSLVFSFRFGDRSTHHGCENILVVLFKMKSNVFVNRCIVSKQPFSKRVKYFWLWTFFGQQGGLVTEPDDPDFFFPCSP